jgi:hypothetical protein
MQNITNYFSVELQRQANIIDVLFQKECEKWSNNNLECKLLILGEAPLSSEKYFYNIILMPNNLKIQITEII